MNAAIAARFLGRAAVAVTADLTALAVDLTPWPLGHRHAWVPSERARGTWPAEPDLDICARNPRHTRRR